MDWPRYYIASLMSHMGFLATELGSLGHVCFPPDSDRIADIAGGPVGANIGSQLHAVQADSGNGGFPLSLISTRY